MQSKQREKEDNLTKKAGSGSRLLLNQECEGRP